MEIIGSFISEGIVGQLFLGFVISWIVAIIFLSSFVLTLPVLDNRRRRQQAPSLAKTDP